MCIYGVINIDMINSRKLLNRPNIQSILLHYIKEVNLNYHKYLLAPITITLGDEWQIILKDPSYCYKFIEVFQKFLKKSEIYIYAGIGIGTLSTDIYKDTRLMDGDCFIKAREALNIVKDKNRFHRNLLYSNDNKVYFKGSEIFINESNALADVSSREYVFNEVAVSSFDCSEEICYYRNKVSLNSIINTLIENTEVLKKKITKKQAEMIELYQQEGSYTNIIKKNPNISKASISQKINVSNYYLIENNKIIIEKLFKLYWEIRKGNENEI